MFIGIEDRDIFQVKLALQVKSCEKQRASARSCEVHMQSNASLLIQLVVYEMLILSETVFKTCVSNHNKRRSLTIFKVETKTKIQVQTDFLQLDLVCYHRKLRRFSIFRFF